MIPSHGKQLILSLIILMLSGVTIFAAGSGSVIHSKHNLSSSGPGDIKSATEDRVCIFCHSSHSSSSEGPLWNHETTTPGKFKTYDRATMASKPEQPTGATKLCLSCHDGTIAVGAIKGLKKQVSISNTEAGGTIPVGRKSNIGTDLSGTHPVSVKYNQATSLTVDHLRWPPIDNENKVGPDASGSVQCTACHDPHDDSKSERYPFWNKKKFDDVCLVCHNF